MEKCVKLPAEIPSFLQDLEPSSGGSGVVPSLSDLLVFVHNPTQGADSQSLFDEKIFQL